ncbi:hypothetical protein FACS189444_4120 [Spirochaetia bacterium]|nr:hypothetical protein FACS189444_4120 [Spirochaetia bacterium]
MATKYWKEKITLFRGCLTCDNLHECDKIEADCADDFARTLFPEQTAKLDAEAEKNDRFTVRPAVMDESRHVSEVENERDTEFFAVYEISPSGLLEWRADFMLKPDAETFADTMNEKCGPWIGLPEQGEIPE